MLLNVYNRFPVNFVKGKGVYLYDDKGEQYLDFVSGIAVNGLGHAHPKMVSSVKSQAEQLFHVSNLYHNEPQNRLAQLIVEKSAFERVFFSNSGAEANELAIKIARKYGNLQRKDKNIIIYMNNSFHGRTTGALAITGQIKYQRDFMPLLPRVVACEFNNIDDFERVFSEEVCGVILEPIQGEGGLSIASKDFLMAVKKRCDESKALLIYDEIQCGLGRTGTFFSFETVGIIPDIVTIAKALGGGLPIGACLTRGPANEVLVPGDHGSTYGGNPFVTAVAYDVLDELTNGGIIAGVKDLSDYALEQLLGLQREFPLIKSIRGQGLLLGLEIDPSIEVGRIILQALKEKFLLVAAGGNIIRYLPPLNVTKDEIDLSIDKWRSTLQHFV